MKSQDKLERAPLIFTLAQVRFSPVLKMDSFVPEIQEILRKKGFPGFKEVKVNNVIFGTQVETQTVTRWMFLCGNKHEAIILTNDFVVYETTVYETFEPFCEKFAMIISLLKEHADIESAERVGFRTVDLITTLDGYSPKEFLAPEMHGFNSKDLDLQPKFSLLESHFETKYGQMKIRTAEPTDGAIMPPDLSVTGLEINRQLDESDPRIVLDIDHFSQESESFDSNNLISTLSSLHDDTKLAFERAITKKAEEIWQKKG